MQTHRKDDFVVGWDTEVLPRSRRDPSRREVSFPTRPVLPDAERLSSL